MITTIEQAREYRAKIEATTVYAPPEVAVKEPSLYPVWSPDAVNYYDGTGEHPQSKVRGRTHPDRLYKCTAPHTSQESWEPDATPALWTVIDETHAGTVDDPVPAARGMEYTYGLYYLDGDDGNIYLCERNGAAPGEKITLQYLPHELVGQYFTLYTPETV